MRPRIIVRPLGRVARAMDRGMAPIMRLLWSARGWDEAPQETHRWNLQLHSSEELSFLKQYWMVPIPGDPDACVRYGFWDLRFHLGGWRNYVVLTPTSWSAPWYVGWTGQDGGGGISRLELEAGSCVRMLRGPGFVRFFGLSAEGTQIPISCISHGELGVRCRYSHERLF